jgi:hypothetical protein
MSRLTDPSRSIPRLAQVPREGWAFVDIRIQKHGDVMAWFENFTRVKLGDSDFLALFFDSANLEYQTMVVLPADRKKDESVHVNGSHCLSEICLKLIPEEKWIIIKTQRRILGILPEVRHAC